jgi:hypothetical protein
VTPHLAFAVLALLATAQAGCRLDASMKVRCRTATDCNDGYTCRNQICERSGEGPGALDASPMPADLTDGPRPTRDVSPALPPDPLESPEMNALAVTDDGRLWHASAVYDYRGEWSQFSELTPRVGNIGRILAMKGQSLGDQVIVLGLAGSTLHELSRRNGVWNHWSQLTGDVSAMGLARMNEHLEACFVSESNGRILIRSRGFDDQWGNATDITDQIGPVGSLLPSRFAQVDCAASGGHLHLVALDADGRAWITSRRDTQWEPMRLLDQVGAVWDDIDVAGLPGELHTMATRLDKQVLDIRANDGAMLVVFDFASLAGPEPHGTVSGTAVAGLFDTLHVLKLVSGSIWHTVRANVYATRNFARLSPPGLNVTVVALVGVVR